MTALWLVVGLLTGWFSHEIHSSLLSIRYQLIKLLKRPLAMLEADPLNSIRVDGSVIKPKPPTEFDDKNDPYRG